MLIIILKNQLDLIEIIFIILFQSLFRLKSIIKNF
jgi:hypothetical protein